MAKSSSSKDKGDGLEDTDVIVGRPASPELQEQWSKQTKAVPLGFTETVEELDGIKNLKTKLRYIEDAVSDYERFLQTETDEIERLLKSDDEGEQRGEPILTPEDRYAGSSYLPSLQSELKKLIDKRTELRELFDERYGLREIRVPMTIEDAIRYTGFSRRVLDSPESQAITKPQQIGKRLYYQQENLDELLDQREETSQFKEHPELLIPAVGISIEPKKAAPVTDPDSPTKIIWKGSRTADQLKALIGFWLEESKPLIEMYNEPLDQYIDKRFGSSQEDAKAPGAYIVWTGTLNQLLLYIWELAKAKLISVDWKRDDYLVINFIEMHFQAPDTKKGLKPIKGSSLNTMYNALKKDVADVNGPKYQEDYADIIAEVEGLRSMESLN
jgi:hypothetical protein